MQGGPLMIKTTLITSAQNEKIKQVIHLRDKKDREKAQLFLIEGYREILRAFEAGRSFSSLFICKELFLGSSENSLIEEIGKKTPIYQIPSLLFEKISYRDRPDGLLAIAPMFHHTPISFIESVKERAKGDPLFLMIAESIEKPGNLGSMFRSCDAAGVHGVIVCDPKTDIFNPNVVRASIGTLFSVPCLECSLQEAVALLQKENIKLVAATPHASEFFTEIDMTTSLAIAMGTEQLGLSKSLMEKADKGVKIPMLGAADSLNVAAATTLMLYEVVRQRRLLVCP